MPGLVEFDPAAMAAAALEVAEAALDDGGPVDAVGITAQRASAIAWDARTGAAARARAWAGRTCARPGPASSCRPRGSASPRASRRPSSPGCWTSSAPTSGSTPSSARWTAGWRGSSAAGRCTSPIPATPRSPGCTASTGQAGAGEAARTPRHPAHGAPRHRRLVGPARRGHRPAGQPAAVRPGRRPAGLPDRAGLHPAGPGQGHLRHRRHARRVRRATPGPGSRPAAKAAASRSSPGSAAAGSDLGRRGHHAGRRHRRRLAGRGPRLIASRGRVRGGGGGL